MHPSFDCSHLLSGSAQHDACRVPSIARARCTHDPSLAGPALRRWCAARCAAPEIASEAKSLLRSLVRFTIAGQFVERDGPAGTFGRNVFERFVGPHGQLRSDLLGDGERPPPGTTLVLMGRWASSAPSSRARLSASSLVLSIACRAPCSRTRQWCRTLLMASSRAPNPNRVGLAPSGRAPREADASACRCEQVPARACLALDHSMRATTARSASSTEDWVNPRRGCERRRCL